MRWLALIFTLALVACGNDTPPTEQTPASTTPSPEAETERLHAWLDERYQEQLSFAPEIKTVFGIKDEDYGRLSDASDAGLDAVTAWRRETLQAMREQFDYDALSPEGQDSWDVWRVSSEQQIASDQYRRNEYLFTQMGGAQEQLAQLLIARHGVDTEQDALDYVSRLQASGQVLRDLVTRARDSAEHGVHAPYFTYDMVRQQITALKSGAPFTDTGASSPIWADLVAKIAALVEAGTIDAQRAAELTEAGRDAMTGEMGPALDEVLEWLSEDQPNAPAVATGVGSLPDGQAYYAQQLALHTTTTMTPEEVHQTGLANVARIHAEMEVVKDEFGFDGSLDEFFNFLRDTKDDPRLYFPDTDEGRQAYIDESKAAIDNIRTQLDAYFGLKPKADIIVKRVEPYRERPGAAQHYFLSTPDGSRPGVYYAHLSDMTAMPKSELEVVAYHEGIPGHHMQLAIASELQDVPEFRKRTFMTAYIEGWGLYSERLALEIPGTYQTPLSNFGRLNTELWRAVRLVVDTGLHAKGWTEEQAVDYMLSNSTTTVGQARSEIRRYIVWPGQATAYMIGMLKILEVRAMAEEALGENFDIRGFHDVVLGRGPVPLDVLERRVRRWVDEQAGA